MKKSILITYIIIILLGINYESLLSAVADTIIVHTLTFDSITGRRGIWKFPDNSNEFRKIIMSYTLKCDPRTTQDGWDCGEWDYLTYNVVYKPTDKLDSNRLTHPYMKVGANAPSDLYYTDEPIYNYYTRKLNSIVYDNTVSEQKYAITTGEVQFPLSNEPTRIQFVIKKADLKNSGLQKGEVHKLILNTQAGSDMILYDFKIKIKSGSSLKEQQFDNSNSQLVYHNNYQFLNTGENEIDFIEPYSWNGVSGIIVEISYHTKTNSSEIILGGNDLNESLISSGNNYYLYFDGKNDYVDCGNMTELNSAKSFTLEGWFNIQEWKAWSKLMGKGSQITIECGDKVGEVYCIIRNPGNTYGYSAAYLELGTWNHIAMVYDGNQSENQDKIKLYINGELINLKFSGTIPTTTPDNDEHFTLASNSNSSALKGMIDEIRIWPNPLDSLTIASWWNKKLTNSHPNYQDIIAYYPIEEYAGTKTKDIIAKHNDSYDGLFIGTPEWKQAPSDELFYNITTITKTPNITLVQGVYESHIESSYYIDTIQVPPISIELFEIVGGRSVRRFDLSYGWEAGWSYTFNSEGVAIDSDYVNYKAVLFNQELVYYSEPFYITEQYEIGRFITPYGKYLDLGPDGFNWHYDVTDYAPLLQGNVEFSAGNQQELIDVKFLFIKGEPARKVLKIDRIWGQFASYLYKDLSDNTQLSEKNIELNPEAEQFMVRTRITGHGHKSNNDNYPWCCEWKDNTHYLLINGSKKYQWKVWREDCSLNPVYPQGGTWPGSREGWCPGDVVPDFDFEITNFIQSDNVTFDYDITKVPTDNLGMGNGNYVMSMDLFQYSAPTHNLDAEIYDVIAPSNWDYYSRKNPICFNPTIIIKNNSVSNLESLKFDYGVMNGTQETYQWNGSISPFKKDTITLPISNDKFWLNDGSNKFKVTISQPNGQEDEYSENNTFQTDFNMPDLYNNQLVLWYKTNNRADDFNLYIIDMFGNVVFNKSGAVANTLYKDTLNLSNGCYTLFLIDRYEYGLSYWAYPEQGSGFLRIHNKEGSALKVFNPDCGKGIIYSFNVGEIDYVQDKNFNDMINIFPNPTEENIKIIINYSIGNANFEIIDIQGNVLFSEKINIIDDFEKVIPLDNFAKGGYNIRVYNDNIYLNKNFIKK